MTLKMYLECHCDDDFYEDDYDDCDDEDEDLDVELGCERCVRVLDDDDIVTVCREADGWLYCFCEKCMEQSIADEWMQRRLATCDSVERMVYSDYVAEKLEAMNA